MTVGQKVYCSDYSSWAEGVVEKIGPKLVHINRHGRTTAYLRNGQSRRDGAPGYFQTEAQHREAQGRNTTIKTLRLYGIEITPRIAWSNKELQELLGSVVDIKGIISMVIDP